MIGLTHLSFGFLLFRLLVEAGKLRWRGPLQILSLMLGTVFPDLDSPFSTIGKFLKPISLEIWERFGHRTLTHSLFGLAHFILIYLLTFNDLVFMFILGYASHLLIDLLSQNGVKLLWPLNLRFVILNGPIETGSWQDFALFITFDVLSFLTKYLLMPVRWFQPG